MKKVTVIGGGGGVSKLLARLRKYENLELSAIISMADSGGSTGKLREQYFSSPVGDLRKSILALSDADPAIRDIFNYRFEGGDLDRHPLGNIALTAAERIAGSPQEAVNVIAALLKARGKVIPVTEENITLHAEYEDGTILSSESTIDNSRIDSRIKRIWIEPSAQANPLALKAIEEADLIVIGPGDFYTSIIPNFLVSGISQAVTAASARKIFIGPLFTKIGETKGLSQADLKRIVENHAGKVDVALFNKTIPSDSILGRYAEAGMEILIDGDMDANYDLIDNPDEFPLSTARKTAEFISRILS